MNKQTEWKQLRLDKESLDFTGATEAHLEDNDGAFVALTMRLKGGRTVRLRHANYGLVIESPVVPMVTKYLVKTKTGLSASFDSESQAKEIADSADAEVTEIQVPRQPPQVEELPF